MHAVRERGRIQHGIPPPVLEGLLLEQPPVDDAEQDALVDAFVGSQLLRIEGAKLNGIRFERLDLRRDPGGREVVQPVVVIVNAIARRDRRVPPREVVEILVHEARELAPILGGNAEAARPRAKRAGKAAAS